MNTSNIDTTNPKAIAKASKELGTKAFMSKDYKEAIKHFTEAIAWDAENRALWSNRSACYIFEKEYEKKDGLFESLKTSLYYSFVPAFTYLLSSGFTYESFATALAGTVGTNAYKYWNSPQVTIFLKVAYLDATAANLHALASYISSYELK